MRVATRMQHPSRPGNAEGRRNGGQDEGEQGIGQVHAPDEHEDRHDGHLHGDHHRRQNEGEQEVLAAEFEPREHVARHGGGQHLPDGDDSGDEHRVEGEHPHVDLPEHRQVREEVEAAGDE